MNIIKLEYNGKKIVAREGKTPESKGTYVIILPDEKTDDGVIRQNIVRVRKNSTQLYSVERDCPGKFFAVELGNDGIVKHKDDVSTFLYKLTGQGEAVKVEDRKFDSSAENSEFPYNIAKKLFDIRTRLDKVLEWKQKIDDLKTRMLNMRLRRLGYNSQQEGMLLLGDYATTCDLNKVVSDLERYSQFEKMQAFSLENLPGFSDRIGDDIVYVEPTEEIITKLEELIKTFSGMCEEEESVLDYEEDITNRKRAFLRENGTRYSSDFAVGIPGILSRTDKEWTAYSEYIYMQGKSLLGQEDESSKQEPKRSILINNMLWRMYAEQIRTLAKLYMGIYFEVLDNDITSQVPGLTTLSSDEYSKTISGVLESDKLSRAIDMENIFVIAINLDFIARAETDLANLDASIRESGVGESIRELIEDARNKIAHRIENIEKRKELEKSKKPNHDENPVGGPGGDNR